MNENQKHWAYSLRPELAAIPVVLLIGLLVLMVFTA